MSSSVVLVLTHDIGRVRLNSGQVGRGRVMDKLRTNLISGLDGFGASSTNV